MVLVLQVGEGGGKIFKLPALTLIPALPFSQCILRLGPGFTDTSYPVASRSHANLLLLPTPAPPGELRVLVPPAQLEAVPESFLQEVATVHSGTGRDGG